MSCSGQYMGFWEDERIGDLRMDFGMRGTAVDGMTVLHIRKK